MTSASIPRAAEVKGRAIHSHTGEWCALCLQEGWRLARDRPGLDVEVLARALAAVSPQGTKYPDRLAAEYARLAAAAAGEPVED